MNLNMNLNLNNFYEFLGFCGGENLEMSIPGSKAWLRIQKGKGTYCPQIPSSGLAHPSSRM